MEIESAERIHVRLNNFIMVTAMLFVSNYSFVLCKHNK